MLFPSFLFWDSGEFFQSFILANSDREGGKTS